MFPTAKWRLMFIRVWTRPWLANNIPQEGVASFSALIFKLEPLPRSDHGEQGLTGLCARRVEVAMSTKSADVAKKERLFKKRISKVVLGLDVIRPTYLEGVLNAHQYQVRECSFFVSMIADAARVLSPTSSYATYVHIPLC